MTEKLELSLEPLGRVTPIYVIGDSHCSAYDGRLYRLAATGRNYMSLSGFVSGASADHFGLGRDSVTPQIFEALKSLGIIHSNGLVGYLSLNNEDLSTSHQTAAAQIPPFCIFHVGELNLRGQLYKGFTDDKLDFILPKSQSRHIQPEYESKNGAANIPISIILEQIEQIYSSLFIGINALKAVGLKRIYLHCLPPPTLMEFTVLHDYFASEKIRYKLTLLVNTYIEKKCREFGVGFIDIWEDVTDGSGRLKPEYELDSIHLHPDSCSFTIDHLFRLAQSKQRDVTNQVRYGTLAQRAKNRGSRQPGNLEDDGFAACGLARAINPGFEPMREMISLEEGDIPDYDWAFRPPETETQISWLAPLPDLLVTLYQLLFETSELRNLLSRIVNEDFIFYSVRPFQIGRSAETIYLDDWADGAWPEGLLRAVVILGPRAVMATVCDRDSEETLAEWGGPIAPGTLLIYDPRRIHFSLKGEPGTLLIDLHFGPTIAEMVPRVIWNGQNCWPGDPFCFTLANALTWPAAPRPQIAFRAIAPEGS